MTKLRYSELKEIERIEREQLEEGYLTSEELAKIKENSTKLCNGGYYVGYFVPASANWSYNVHVVQFNGKFYKVSETLGHIVHAQKFCLVNIEG